MGNLVIYQKYTELIYYTYNLTKKYPKSENFVLVKEVRENLYQGLKILMHAIKCYDKREKLRYLNELDINLTLLKVFVRISYNCKYISLQNYQTWSKQITDICNILGAWINSCLKR